MKSRFDIEEGSEVGLLTVTKAGHHSAEDVWEVKCLCGKDFPIQWGVLKRGSTRSCGCVEKYDKICVCCGSLFYTNSHNAIRCKSVDCKRERSRTYRRSQRIADREADNERVKKWRRSAGVAIMLTCAKSRAKKAGIPFSITKEDVYFPEKCPALGIPIWYSNEGRTLPNSPSLDRVIPELGYVPGNVFLISHKANRIKNNSTYEELMKIAEYVKIKSSALSSQQAGVRPEVK